MSTGMTPVERQELQAIEAIRARVQNLHAQVERYAAEREENEVQSLALRRAIVQLRTYCNNAGMNALGQACGNLEMVTRRSAARHLKIRQLREGIGSLKLQLEGRQRAILAKSRQSGGSSS